MRTFTIAATVLATLNLPAFADGVHAVDMHDAVVSPANSAINASFDILAAHVHRDGQNLTFHMTAAAPAGEHIPTPVGSLASAPVYAYVWPTSLDPSAVGFEAETGILALAATSHPDFDDTPLYDESADGDKTNDGAEWHNHWVVLTPNEACGEGALSVRDIPEGATPKLPETWPGLPLFIDSPAFTPEFAGDEVVVNVPFNPDVNLIGVNYDGVTSALKVNANLHSPLLCVTDVFDVASGDLSLPGAIE